MNLPEHRTGNITLVSRRQKTKINSHCPLNMNTLVDILNIWFQGLKEPMPAVYVVGGAVRDHAMGRPVTDLDVVCSQPKAFAKKLAENRLATVVPFLKKKALPCFRVVDRDRFTEHIDITLLSGGDIQSDLSRRDFTINAMALPILADGRIGEIIDPLNGIEDLKSGIVRAAGKTALADDPVRVLRAVRFAAMFDFSISRRTLAGMEDASAGLAGVAGERTWAELEKILSHPFCGRHIRMLDSTGALAVIFPEIKTMKNCRQNPWHHLDVWNHSLAVLDECERIFSSPSDLFGEDAGKVMDFIHARGRWVLMKLAALMHDVGKPDTKVFDNTTGKISFRGHDRHGAESMDIISGRLRLSGWQSAFLHQLVFRHMQVLFLSRPDVKPKTLLGWFRKLGEDMIASVILSLADARSAKGAAVDAEFVTNHEQWVAGIVSAYYRDLQPRLSAPALIRGKDLLALGVPEGPEIGRILALVREAQEADRISSSEQAIRMAKNIVARYGK